MTFQDEINYFGIWAVSIQHHSSKVTPVSGPRVSLPRYGLTSKLIGWFVSFF